MHPLPRFPTPFLGRQVELQAVMDAMVRSRLVTLVGMGGAGKTRLAVEAVAQAVANRPSLWAAYVDLAAREDRWSLATSVANAVGLGTSDDLDPSALLERVAVELDTRTRGILLLDNAEEDLAGVVRAASALLSGSDVSLVVTSRSATGLIGEHQIAVEGLDVASSVRLFTDRAAARGAHIDPTDPVVVALMERLDRWPLAIEMAAARSRLVSPAALLERLANEPLPTLPSAPERHQTMRSVVAWSWSQLTEHERSVLAQLSVFRGGFEIDAAERVVESESSVVDAIEGLVDHGLISLQSGRPRLLQTVQTFAAERLSADGDLAGTWHRHAHHYLDWLGPVVMTNSPNLNTAVIQVERDNLIAIHERFSASNPELGTGAAMGLALLPNTPRAWALELLEPMTRLEERSPQMVRALVTRSVLKSGLGLEKDAWEDAQRARAVAEQRDVPLDDALARCQASKLSALRGEVAESLRLAESVLTLVGVPAANRIEAMHLVSTAMRMSGEQEEGLRVLLDAMASAKRHGVSDFRCALSLASVLGELGRHSEALAVLERSRPDREGNAPALAAHLFIEGACAIHAGTLETAEVTNQLCAEVCRELGESTRLFAVLLNLATLQISVGRVDDAERGLAEARALLPTDHAMWFHMRAVTGITLLIRGRWASARRWLSEALEVHGVQRPSERVEYQGYLALALNADGDAARARALLTEIETGAAKHNPGFVARCRAILAGELPEPGVDPSHRLLRAIAESLPERAEIPRDDLLVGQDCRWFEAPGAPRVSLARRRAQRKILEALVAVSERTGDRLDWSALFESGWPGEKATFESARHRVYVAVHSLRKAGLAGILNSDDEGYWLALPVVRGAEP